MVSQFCKKIGHVTTSEIKSKSIKKNLADEAVAVAQVGQKIPNIASSLDDRICDDLRIFDLPNLWLCLLCLFRIFGCDNPDFERYLALHACLICSLFLFDCFIFLNVLNASQCNHRKQVCSCWLCWKFQSSVYDKGVQAKELVYLGTKYMQQACIV